MTRKTIEVLRVAPLDNAAPSDPDAERVHKVWSSCDNVVKLDKAVAEREGYRTRGRERASIQTVRQPCSSNARPAMGRASGFGMQARSGALQSRERTHESRLSPSRSASARILSTTSSTSWSCRFFCALCCCNGGLQSVCTVRFRSALSR